MSSAPTAFLDELRSRLSDAIPGLIVWQEREGARETRLIFPAAPGSDYRFTAFVRDRLDRVAIQAELVRDAEPRFWRHTLDAPDAAALADRVLAVLVPLLAGPSEIRQRRGLFAWSFVCDVPGDGVGPLPGVRRLRGVGRAPPVAAAEAVYHAGPAKTRRRAEG